MKPQLIELAFDRLHDKAYAYGFIREDLDKGWTKLHNSTDATLFQRSKIIDPKLYDLWILGTAKRSAKPKR